MEDDFQGHPDIDSVLEMHLGFGDFSYRTREVDGSTIHQVMRLKKGVWKEHFTIEHDEVKSFDTDELATFVIHQISMNRAVKRRMIGLLLLFFGIALPIVLYSVLVLGLKPEDDLEVLLIAGGVMAVFIPLICFMVTSAEISVDRQVHATRSNFIDLLKKMIELSEEDYQKRPLENRIDRLTGRSEHRPIE